MAPRPPRLVDMEQQLEPRPTIRLRVPLVAGEEETELLDGELRYEAADPFAVTLAVTTTAGQVAWTFARELLADGRYEPAGDGDVQVWPCLSIGAEAVTVVELHAPEGDALLQISSRIVDRFMADVFAAVPQGSEGAHLAIDDLVEQLLG